MKPGTLEHDLHVALQAGDVAAVEAARVALVQRWSALAWNQALKWFKRTGRGDLDDYRSAAQLGLWDAVLRFQPERGYVFATYAGWWLHRYLKEAAHGEAAGGFHVPVHHGFVHVSAAPFSGASGANSDDDFDHAGTVPQPEADPREEPPEAAALRAAVDRIATGDRERLVLRRRYREGKSLTEVGEEFGISKERVRQIEARAIERLRQQPGVMEQFLAG